MQVADHLDHLHYLHDILCLKIDKLNVILTDHLLNRLLIPLYVYSLPSHGLDDSVSKVLWNIACCLKSTVHEHIPSISRYDSSEV